MITKPIPCFTGLQIISQLILCDSWSFELCSVLLQQLLKASRFQGGACWWYLEAVPNATTRATVSHCGVLNPPSLDVVIADLSIVRVCLLPAGKHPPTAQVVDAEHSFDVSNTLRRSRKSVQPSVASQMPVLAASTFNLGPKSTRTESSQWDHSKPF